MGGTPPRNNARNFDKSKSSGHVWLSIADLPLGLRPTVADSKEYLSDQGAAGIRIVPAGTLLVSFKLTLGRLAFAGCDLRTNEAIAALRDLNEQLVSRDYLYWCLTNFDWEKAAEGEDKIKGKTLNKAKLEQLEILFPPLAEQQRIVTLLDKAFVRVSSAAAIAEQNVLNATLLFETARKALFSNRNSSWETRPIGKICENLDGRRRPVTKRDRVPGNVPYYGASGVVDHVQTHLFDEDLLLVSEDGANLLARTYPIAFSISGPAWVNNHAHVLRFGDKCTQKFVEHYLNSIDLEPYVTGMAQPKLNQGALNKIPVPLPSLNRQAEIVSSLEQLQLEAQDLLKVFERKLDALAELKQSLLAMAFSGDLSREPIAA